MADGFVPSMDEEYGPVGDLPEADWSGDPIDPENPGFASLLPAIQAVLNGELEPTVLQGYVSGLWPRLEQAFDDWERVIGAQLEGLSGEEAEPVRAAYETTGDLLRTMGETLALVEQGLTEDDAVYLEQAEQRLAGVHQEVQQALG